MENLVNHRNTWIELIKQNKNSFSHAAVAIEELLDHEMETGAEILLSHLRMAGNIPETIPASSSAEKLYAKYTDIIVARALAAIGMDVKVLTERGDAADVEADGYGFSMVADAKAFRLSRTAKNAKDYKIEAMHGWKKGRDHAVVVCPHMHLQPRASQIYQQAISRGVTIMPFALLSALVKNQAQPADLLKILQATANQPASKNAESYWQCIRNSMDDSLSAAWADEDAIVEQAAEIQKMLDDEHRAAHNRSVIAKVDAMSVQEMRSMLIDLLSV